MTEAETVRLLENVLEQERTALLKADFSALDQLVAHKTEHLSTLESQAVDATTLARLATMVKENQLLILAAQNGIADARMLLMHVLTPPPVVTYNSDGMATKLHKAAETLSRKT